MPEPRTPAERAISRAGGVRELAKILGVHESTVYKLTYPKRRGGQDGLIPSKYQLTLTRAAAEGLIYMPAHELVPMPGDTLPLRDDRAA